MNKFLLGIIAVLVAIILLQRACTPKCTKTKELVTVYDTILKHDSSVIVKKMRINHRDTMYIPEDPIYVFDTIDHEAARQTFNKLVKKYTTKNMYIDTILIDTFGKIYVYDTVQFNQLGNRGIVKNYTIPVYTKYIKVPEEPKRQVYIGGGLDGTYINKQVNLNMVEAGLIYKNKKDQMYGAKAILDFKGNIYYGVQSYWKIKLK